MTLSSNLMCKTYYEILGVKEDVSYDEIRTTYRSAILNFHPDKVRNAYDVLCANEVETRFLEVQKAWEILGNPRSRAIYDNDLRASRQDAMTAEDVSLEDLTVEDAGNYLELSYPCRCGDCYSIDSLELAEMGYPLTAAEGEISLRTRKSVPISIVLPCGSCSLKVRLLINSDIGLQTDEHL